MENEKDYGEMMEKALNGVLSFFAASGSFLFVAWLCVAVYRACL